MGDQKFPTAGFIAGVLWVLLLITASCPSEAVVFYGTDDPEFNTLPPGGALADSGWRHQGQWYLFLGTPVSSNYFITAKHVGGEIGATFILQDRTYTTTAEFDHPTADLTLWRVGGVFPDFAPVYTGSDEIGRHFVVFGRGRRRGAEVLFDGQVRGWRWGDPDFRLRWGENTVAAITDCDGSAITSTNQLQCLRATFDAEGGPDESHLSNGDSGGAVFIVEEAVWKIAGISVSVDGRYNTNDAGAGFDATLFDERGFYRGSENAWELQSGEGAQPGGFYAVRLSAHGRWIHNVVTYGNPKGEMFVERAPVPQGPFVVEDAAEINGEKQTVRIPRRTSSQFFRLRSSEPARITGIGHSGDWLELRFE